MGRVNTPSEADLAWRELNVSKSHDKHLWQSGRGGASSVWVGKLYSHAPVTH